MVLTRRSVLAGAPLLMRGRWLQQAPAPGRGLHLHPELREIHFGAYYFAWYQRGGARWRLNQRADFLPVGGPYDSADARTIDRHLRTCHDNGIRVLGTNWHNWASIDERVLSGEFQRRLRKTRMTYFLNNDLAIAFNGPERLRKMDFDRDQEARRFLFRQGQHVALKHMQHPNYLWVRGRPLVELYVSRAVRRGFDALVESFVHGVRSVLGVAPFLMLDEIWWGRTLPGSEASIEYARHLRWANAVTAWTSISQRVLNSPTGPLNVRQFTRRSVYEYRRHRAFRNRHQKKVPIVPQVTLRIDHLDPTRHLYMPPTLDGAGHPRYEDDTRMALRMMLPFVEPVHDHVGYLMLGTFNEWQEGNAFEPTRLGTRDRHGLAGHCRDILRGVRFIHGRVHALLDARQRR